MAVPTLLELSMVAPLIGSTPCIRIGHITGSRPSKSLTLEALFRSHGDGYIWGGGGVIGPFHGVIAQVEGFEKLSAIGAVLMVQGSGCVTGVRDLVKGKRFLLAAFVHPFREPLCALVR